MEYLIVANITKTVGLKGEVKLYPFTHFRDSRFKKGSHLFLLNDEKEAIEELIVKSHRVNKDFDIISFENKNKIEDVEYLIGKSLFVIKDNNFLKKGQYFYCDLEKCDVYFDNDTYIGKVKKVEEYSAYATLRVVREKHKDVLIPFVKSFILDVNLEEKKIIVKYIEGLLWK